MSPLRIGSAIVFAVVGLLALSTIFGSFYTVNEGDRGVILTNGRITGVAQPGLGFKLPLITSVADISTRSNTRVYEGLDVYTYDQQPAKVKASVTWRVPANDTDVKQVYSQYGSTENLAQRVIDRRVSEELEKVFGKFTALNASRERTKLGIAYSDAIKAIKGPFLIESVQIEGFDFSDAYEKSIEARMEAEVSVQKREQDAAKAAVDAKIQVIQAQALADSQLATAKANAEAVRMQGDAEASAIRAKSDALRDSPNLVALTKAERWNGALPTTVLPGDTVPFLDLAAK